MADVVEIRCCKNKSKYEWVKKLVENTILPIVHEQNADAMTYLIVESV